MGRTSCKRQVSGSIPLCGVIGWAFECRPAAARGTDEQAPVGPLRTGIVVFEFEADACGAASLHRGVDVGGGFLNAEMRRFGSEADEIRHSGPS
jgi:hypothetical protein